MNWVDFFAILPFYMDLVLEGEGGGSTTALRVVRLVRIFRVFKVSRYVKWIGLLLKTLATAIQPLIMVLFVVTISVVFFSSAMYYWSVISRVCNCFQ